MGFREAMRLATRRFQKTNPQGKLAPMATFEEIKKDKESYARAGIVRNKFGEQMTPFYVFAGTHGYVRTLEPQDLRDLSVKGLVANTFHLWQNPGHLKVKENGGLHKHMDYTGFIMTDSGGFQVFSYGASREHGVLKVGNVFPGEQKDPTKPHSGISPVREKSLQAAEAVRGTAFSNGVSKVRITEDGAYFTLDDKEHFLDAKKSIEIQQALGADVILAFDECTSPKHDYEYVKESLARTNRWALESITAKTSDQALFGIIQGSNFRDLREESAQFITSQPFGGIAVGGSLGDTKQEMHVILDWLAPILETRPNWQRHLLGIGQIDDLFEGVERGIDTFDCVIPTREARHGSAWTKNGRFDIWKSLFKNDTRKLEDDCECLACQKYTRKELHEMRRANSLEVGKMLTIHNIYFFQNLMAQIRQSILDGRFKEFKKEFLSNLKSSAV